MERVTALQQNQITPYVVFDGGPLPMKKGTEEERRKYVRRHLLDPVILVSRRF